MFSPNEGGFYPYTLAHRGAESIEIVPIGEIQPPLRTAVVPSFKKYKLIPILFSFRFPESTLPAVEVTLASPGGRYRFKVQNGSHRYYASVAAGYENLPIIVRQRFELGA